MAFWEGRAFVLGYGGAGCCLGSESKTRGGSNVFAREVNPNIAVKEGLASKISELAIC